MQRTPRRDGERPGPGSGPGARLSAVGHILGVSALVAGGLTVALWLLAAVVLIGPLLFWLAWNVLGLGPAFGLPELGFWATVLATLFLIVGWFGKVTITAVVFLVDPAWLHRQAVMHWPDPTLRNFVAIALLAVLAAGPHRGRHKSSSRQKAKLAPSDRLTV